MKIICFPSIGNTLGGSHVSALNLILNLNPERFTPLVIIHSRGILSAYLKHHNVKFVLIPNVNLNRIFLPHGVSLLQLFKAAYHLSKFLKINNISIVHTNDYKMHILWCLTAKIANIKFVWHQRNPYPPRLASLMINLADAVITTSNFCKNSLPKRVINKTYVIDNPFYTEVDKPHLVAQHAEIKKLLISHNCKHIIGYISNFSDRKRPHIFVKIIAFLNQKYGNKFLGVMIGALHEPHASNVIQAIAQHDLNDQIILCGPKFPIEPWLRCFDVLVCPALNEGFGRVLVEAMLSGVPVVASDHGGHKEIILNGINGILVEPSDIQAFCCSIISFFENPDFTDKLTSRAREIAINRFSVIRHARAIEDIYSSI